MQIKVTQNEVKINKDILNDGEYNIHKCQFDFDEEYTGLVQKAVFTLNDGTSYLETIVNNECNIPIEVLEEGVLKIGVYAYETNNDELVLRYSPSPDIIHVFDGSYVKDAQNSEGGTPTEYEQLESRVNTALNEIDEALEDVETAVNEANNLDIDVSKTGKVATIDVTKKNGTVKTVTLSDGTSLQFKWEGTKLGIKTENEESYTYVDLQGPIGQTGPQGAPFQIKKTYATIEQMVADYDNMEIGDYVMISGSVEDEDNAKLFVKTETEDPVYKWQYLGDFSGATGIQGPTGATPNIQIGTVTSGSTPSVTRTGTNENPVLNFVLQKGDTGPRGETGATGNGILSIKKTATAGLVDTYTITYTDGTTTTFDVTNGEDGEVTQTQLDETNNNVSWLQKLTEQMPHVSGQGTDLSLESVLNYRLMKFLPQGVSSQDGEPTPTTPIPVNNVTGDNSLVLQNENLFNYNNYFYDTSISSDGKIISGTQNNLYYIPVSYGNSYRISYENTTSSNMVYGFCGSMPSIGKDCTYNVSNTNALKNITFIPSQNDKYLCIRINRDNQFPYISNIMFVKGSTEPSTYVEHEEQNYPITLKSWNMFDINGLGFENGYYDASGNFTSNNANGCFSFISISPNTGYTFNLSTTVRNISMVEFDSSQTFIKRTNLSSVSSNSITTTSTTKYIKISVNIDGSTKVTKDNVGVLKPQLTKGLDVKEYHPYTENPIELNSSPDGTIRDAIIGTPDNWYKREYIGKVVLDGSETWIKRTDGAFQTGVNGVVNRTVAVSNYFNYNRTSDTTGAFYTVDNYLRFFYNEMSTVEDFKTWLSAHNTVVYYPLAQYTDVPITDTTLISQLNDIYNNAHSYNGVTNITTTYEDGNEQMYLDIEALKNVWEVTE